MNPDRNLARQLYAASHTWVNATPSKLYIGCLPFSRDELMRLLRRKPKKHISPLGDVRPLRWTKNGGVTVLFKINFDILDGNVLFRLSPITVNLIKQWCKQSTKRGDSRGT